MTTLSFVPTLSIVPRGLESTLVIPVVLGVLVAAVFTESWGWEFVGVVVPGYFASLALIDPVVASVVGVEALATYGLAVGLDRGLTAAGLAHPVFGRDRFYLLLAASVAVRLACEGFVLQALAALLANRAPGLQAIRHELFGIGLVLVPLTANRLWRPGVSRGAFQLAVEAAAVAALIRFVFVPFTNFSLGGFDPSYDPMALAFLTSPGTQMVLLVTAAVASYCNRRYGWDFHGILVPALLALTVLTPFKLLGTLVEVALIVLLGRMLTALPPLRTANLEGPRRVVLCMTLGIGVKLLLARLMVIELPAYRPTDLLGFGYLLPSLLAERIWIKRNAPLVILPTLISAGVGTAVTALVAVALRQAAPAQTMAPSERFETLSQAVVVLLPRLAQMEEAKEAPIAGAAPTTAETEDGYQLTLDARAGKLTARCAGATRALAAPAEEAPALAAARAARAQGAALVLSALGDGLTGRVPGLATRPAPAPAASRVTTTARTWTSLLRVDSPLGSRARGAFAEIEKADARALASIAGQRMDATRNDAPAIARSLTPFGLGVTTAGGAIVVTGDSWPVAALLPEAPAVVASAFASEWGSREAALRACELLRADCVLARDDSGSAVPLAVALADRRARPLLIVRGTERPLGGDGVLLTSPAGPNGTTALWLEPLAEAIEGRLSLGGGLPIMDLAPLRAFPPRPPGLAATALLWLSPRGRRIVGAIEEGRWAEDDVIALASSRAMRVIEGDVSRWLTAGTGAPSDGALARAEAIARSGDMASFGPGRLALLVDRERHMGAIAVQELGRRALVFAGSRRPERAVVASSDAAERALRAGVRTLIAAQPSASR